MMFSLEQVRDIVQRTVEERERVLREHYDRVLQQKLQGARRPRAGCHTRTVADPAARPAQSNGKPLQSLTRTTSRGRSSRSARDPSLKGTGRAGAGTVAHAHTRPALEPSAMR